jgi:hypothetical protein
LWVCEHDGHTGYTNLSTSHKRRKPVVIKATPGAHPKSSANSGKTHTRETNSSITPLNGTTLRDNFGTPEIAIPAYEPATAATRIKSKAVNDDRFTKGRPNLLL